jgi:hypothetical protein
MNGAAVMAAEESSGGAAEPRVVGEGDEDEDEDDDAEEVVSWRAAPKAGVTHLEKQNLDYFGSGLASFRFPPFINLFGVETRLKPLLSCKEPFETRLNRCCFFFIFWQRRRSTEHSLASSRPATATGQLRPTGAGENPYWFLTTLLTSLLFFFSTALLEPLLNFKGPFDWNPFWISRAATAEAEPDEGDILLDALGYAEAGRPQHHTPEGGVDAMWRIETVQSQSREAVHPAAAKDVLLWRVETVRWPEWPVCFQARGGPEGVEPIHQEVPIGNWNFESGT